MASHTRWLKQGLMVSGLAFSLLACSPKDEQATEQTSEEQITQTEQQKNTPVLEPNVSQQFRGESEIDQRLAKALPEIRYFTSELNDYARQVNAYIWQRPAPSVQPTVNQPTQHAQPYAKQPTHQTAKHQKNATVTADEIATIKIQALLNWHHHGVGAVDGKFSDNTIKAMQAFQKARNLPITEQMDETTWQVLTQNKALVTQPVLVNYTLTAQDVSLIPRNVSQYKSVQEAIAEKFRMSRDLLKRLNPNTPLKAGKTIIVYNPGQPNQQPISRVVVIGNNKNKASKERNILYAYNAHGQIVASYPTTVGSKYTPSPKGKYKVLNRVLHPTYNKDFTNKNTIIVPGPNNPVGNVWLGLSKPSYGIHGSPEPELISRQGSLGCVRLTNWDALSLYGTIEIGAEVELL